MNKDIKKNIYNSKPGRAFVKSSISGSRTFNRPVNSSFKVGSGLVDGRRFAKNTNNKLSQNIETKTITKRGRGNGGIYIQHNHDDNIQETTRNHSYKQAIFKPREETSKMFVAKNNNFESIMRKPLQRRIHGDKKILSTRRFNYTCFIRDNNDQYVVGPKYDGNFGEIKKYSAHNKTERHREIVSNKGLYKGDPVKALTLRLPGSDGRNNNGHITSAHRRTACRRMYRKVDFFRDSQANATVLRIEKDPNRNAFLALVKDEDKRVYYVPATINMRVGHVIQSGPQADCVPGNVLTLENIDNESLINNIEITPGSGSKMVRSAGTYATLVRKEGGYAFIRLPSGEERKFLLSCKATVGQMSNPNYNRQKIGSAGNAFYMGHRPVNRPICRNPVDHPMGGRTSGGKVFRNKNGKLIKGQRTRCPRKSNKLIYASRHKRAA